MRSDLETWPQDVVGQTSPKSVSETPRFRIQEQSLQPDNEEEVLEDRGEHGGNEADSVEERKSGGQQAEDRSPSEYLSARGGSLEASIVSF